MVTLLLIIDPSKTFGGRIILRPLYSLHSSGWRLVIRPCEAPVPLPLGFHYSPVGQFPTQKTAIFLLERTKCKGRLLSGYPEARSLS